MSGGKSSFSGGGKGWVVVWVNHSQQCGKNPEYAVVLLLFLLDPRSQFDFAAKGLYGPNALLFESLSKEQ